MLCRRHDTQHNNSKVRFSALHYGMKAIVLSVVMLNVVMLTSAVALRIMKAFLNLKIIAVLAILAVT